MPRKAKDEEVIENINSKKSTTSKKVASTAKSASAKRTTNSSKKTANSKNTTTKKTVASKKSTSVEKSTSVKRIPSVKKSTASKKSTTTKKAATAKKSANTSKTSATKSADKKSTTRRTSKKLNVPIEYYDLPTAYDKTVVKILAQTPSCLFVYWEIAEKDKLKFQKQYGEGFFQDTKPYLIITNETMNYSFEIEVNDYANSWYIHINDSNCKYAVKLVRKPINYEVPISAPVIDIISSNETDAPNDHILFDKLGKTVFFKNVQTNIVSQKDISSLSFISNIGRIYNIYDFYKEIYKNELNGDELGIKLSSSQSSSFFK